MKLSIFTKIVIYYALQYALWYSLGGLWSLSSSSTPDAKPDARIDYPNTIMEARILQNVVMKDYVDQHLYYTIILFSSAFLFKQSYLGTTAILTMISGSLFGILPAWILCSFLHAVGCCASYINCLLTWRPVIEWLLSTKKQSQQNQVRKMIKRTKRLSILRFLTGIRLLPLPSDFLINMLSCQFEIPLWIHFTSTLIASVPYTFWILLVGSQLHNFNTFPELLLSSGINFKLIVVSLFMLSFLLLHPFAFLLQDIGDVLRENRNGAA